MKFCSTPRGGGLAFFPSADCNGVVLQCRDCETTGCNRAGCQDEAFELYTCRSCSGRGFVAT